MDDKAHRGGGQQRGKSHFIMGGFNKRPAGVNKDKRGQKVNYVTRHAAAMPPSSTSSTPNTALV